MPSIFSKIIAGEIPSHKVAESEDYYAFLDIHPLREGHTLVIPKEEVDYLFDLSDPTLSGLMLFAKQVAKAIESVIPCNRVGVAVIGLEVPHAHVHLVPIDGIHDLDFGREKLQLTMDQLAEIAQKIHTAYEAG